MARRRVARAKPSSTVPAAPTAAGMPVAGSEPEPVGVRVAASTAVGPEAAPAVEADPNGHTPLVTFSAQNPLFPSAYQISPRAGTNAGADMAYDVGASLPTPGLTGWMQYANFHS